jgi:predicted RNA-binding Zn-ribbon protein involved in translation (DUF1610 family)
MMHIKPFNEGKIYNCSNPECDNKIDSKPEENKCPVCGENVIEKDTITRKKSKDWGDYMWGDIDRHELEKELEHIQYMITDLINRGDADLARRYYDRYRELLDVYGRYFGGRHNRYSHW